MLRFGDLWRIRLVKASLFAKPVIDDGRIVWGRSTILFEPCASPSMGAGPRDERLSTLLAVAGVSQPSDGLALLFKTAGAEWLKGERAVAAIRLAFAPVPPLDENGAYRLFLAEQALDAGHDPALLMREFGIGDGIEILKYNRDQPRVPKGNGRESGQFGSSTQAGPPDVSVAFLAPSVADRLKETDAPSPFQVGPPPRRFGDFDLDLDPAPLPLPIPIPFPVPDPKTDDEDGPACPAMRPDRPNNDNPAGQWEEFRLSLLVNPSSPTPKKTPAQPNVTSMAYYFRTGEGDQEVAIDDCKRTTEPSPILTITKGTAVEGKTEGAAALALKDFPNNQASTQYDKQFRNQYKALKFEGKGRRLLQCVGSSANAEALREKYKFRDFPNAEFRVCP